MVRIERGVRDTEVSSLGSLCVERREVLINPTLLRLAKGMGELTKQVLTIGRAVGKKRVGRKTRFWRIPEGDNIYAPCPGTCRT